MADDTNDIDRTDSSDRSTKPSYGHRASRRAVLGSVAGLTAASVGSTAVSATFSSSVSSPTVEGPIEGGSRTGGPLLAAPHDLESYGYVEEEYFIAGEARHDDSFIDGEQAGETSEYKTRVLVYRPKRRRDFNGTVTAEWLNVSTQMDAPVAWPNAYDSLMRNGTAVAPRLGPEGRGRRLSDRPGSGTLGPRAVREPPPPRRPIRDRHLRPGDHRAQAARLGPLGL